MVLVLRSGSWQSLLEYCYEYAPTRFFIDFLQDNVYDCDLQVIVQRALASKDMSHAKGACVLAGWLKVDLFFILHLMIAL